MIIVESHSYSDNKIDLSKTKKEKEIYEENLRYSLTFCEVGPETKITISFIPQVLIWSLQIQQCW